MKKKSYITNGVCAREISFDYKDGKIYNLEFAGGCNGNLKALSMLIEGKNMKEIADTLEGNKCNNRDTSCADQLVKAIREVI
ncbi:MAG: TIGR03905 family TSCPD domain-containing protein [Anaeroplasmataceae bacterium]